MAQKRPSKVHHSRTSSLPQSLDGTSGLKNLYQQQRLQLASLMQQLRDKSQQVKDLRLKVKLQKKEPRGSPPVSAGKHIGAGNSHSFWIEDEKEECSFADVASMGLWVANPSLRKASRSPVNIKQISMKRLKQSWKANSVQHSVDRKSGAETATSMLPSLDRYFWHKTASGKALPTSTGEKEPAGNESEKVDKGGHTHRKPQVSHPHKQSDPRSSVR